MKIEFDEYVDETKAMSDVRNHTYRVDHPKTWDGKPRRELVKIKYEEFIDADRAGFTGYVWQSVTLPLSLILQIAEDYGQGREG